MTLQKQMDAVKKDFIAQVPEQTLEIMTRAGEKLHDSGLAEQAVNVGDKAPDFLLRNTAETNIGLKALLKNGPVVLSFFRGKW